MKRYRKPAPSEHAILCVLLHSPLPWTTGMLLDWVGYKNTGTTLLSQMRQGGRLLRLQKGLYTAPKDLSTSNPFYPEPIT